MTDQIEKATYSADELREIKNALSKAFYGTNPHDYSDGPSDLLPLITIDGATWCVGSNMEGHDGYPGRVMCRACGAHMPTDLSGHLLPHWSWDVEHLINQAGLVGPSDERTPS